jgi:hypothetical protein
MESKTITSFVAKVCRPLNEELRQQLLTSIELVVDWVQKNGKHHCLENATVKSVLVRVAELRQAGINARPYMMWDREPDGDRFIYYVDRIALPDGSFEIYSQRD